jgi:hypothetical protein
MKLVSTPTLEIYDSVTNVRTDFPPETRQLTIMEDNNDVYRIAVAADISTPTVKTIPIVATGCEYLAIYTNIPVLVNLNGFADAINVGVTDVGGHWVLMGTAINSLTISNASTTDIATVRVIVGNII